MEKKKKYSVQNGNKNVYFLMCICNYEARSDTETDTVFCIQGSMPETNFKISHAKCISNTSSSYFRCHVLKGSYK